MSEWNRPMRPYLTGKFTCATCGGAIRQHRIGWRHVRRIGIKDPAWHLAVPGEPRQ